MIKFLAVIIGVCVVVFGIFIGAALTTPDGSPVARAAVTRAPVAAIDPLRQQAEEWNAKADKLQAEHAADDRAAAWLGERIRNAYQRQRVFDRCVTEAEDTIQGCTDRSNH